MPFAEKIVAFGRELSVLPRFRGNGGLSAFRTYRKLTRSWWRGLGISTVLDIGANTGQFGLSARLALPHATIHSFEPLPGPFAALQRLSARYDNWFAHNVALGSNSGRETMFENAYTVSSSLLPMAEAHKTNFPGTGSTREVTISIERLDEVYERLQAPWEILLKLDVQGFEAEVIAGARRTLGLIKAMIVEVSYIRLYEGQPLFEDIDRLLRDEGFIFQGLFGQCHGTLSGQALQGDAIYLRAEHGQFAR